MKLAKFLDFAPLHEARYEDLYGSNFVSFVQKYKDLIEKGKLKKPEKYFVQFTNERDTVLDKSIHQSPDHSDPIGLYAYPLQYVLDHPGDIWYGSAARNLRVIKDKSKWKLVLTSIRTRATLNKALRSIGFSDQDSKRLVAIAQHNYQTRFTGPNAFAKLFMTVLQMDLEGERDANKNFKTLSGKEQTRRLLNGYDAIEDRSRNLDDAIINDREPEQICFLSRAAFDVVEVVHLHRSQKKEKQLAVGMPDVRKLAALICQALDDKLVSHDNIAVNEERYWTKKGRRIELDFHVPSAYRDETGWGQKLHRYGTESDHRRIRGRIYWEYDPFLISHEENVSFAEVVEDVKWQVGFNKEYRQPNPDWKPETKESFLAAKKAKEAADLKKSQEDYSSQADKERLTLINRVWNWAKKLEIPFEIPDNMKVIIGIASRIERVFYNIRNKKLAASDFATSIPDVLEALDTDRQYYGSDEDYAFARACSQTLLTIAEKHPFVFSEADYIEYRFYNYKTE